MAGAKNCYPSLFSYKVIGKRRGKNRTEAESIAPFVSPTVTAGANKSVFLVFYISQRASISGDLPTLFDFYYLTSVSVDP